MSKRAVPCTIPPGLWRKGAGCFVCFLLCLATANVAVAERSKQGLQALYDFRDSSGDVVKDRSGKGAPVDLRVSDMKAVRRSKGSLELMGNTLVRSNKPAVRITDAIQKSGEMTVEAWVHSAGDKQSGPARIVTISRDSNERNVTLGQDC